MYGSLVSIPSGTIKIAVHFNEYFLSKVSIPSGTIKIEAEQKEILKLWKFQFHLVRLKSYIL